MSDSAVTDIPDGVVETVVTAACNANRTGGCGWPKCAPLAGCRIFVLGVQGALTAMPPPPEREEALRIAREAAIEECAVWHDKQASAWQDQAHGASRQIGGSDEAYAAEFRAQHEAYTKYRIIHEQSARDLRALLGARAP